MEALILGNSSRKSGRFQVFGQRCWTRELTPVGPIAVKRDSISQGVALGGKSGWAFRPENRRHSWHKPRPSAWPAGTGHGALRDALRLRSSSAATWPEILRSLPVVIDKLQKLVAGMQRAERR
jgi:hypothetical protein